MRRLFVLFAAALGGTFAVAAPASAHLAGPGDSTGNRSIVVPAASDPAPAVLTALVKQAPTLVRYRVVSGDTLSGIGTRFDRTWPNLASYNHIPNADLIYVDQIVVIPPVSYSGSYTRAAPSYTPPAPVRHTTVTYTAPRRTYTPSPAPVVRSYSGAPGSYQACVATRESGNGSGSSNIYGFLQSTWNSLGYSGSPGGASRSQQDAAFQRLYSMDGRQPWSPYDGC